MSRCLVLACLAAFAAGCGGDTKYEPKPLTDEQKRAIKEEDDKVLNEESGGKGYGERKKTVRR